jgi:ethanolamine ammonia-lyase large subunit
VTRLQILIEVLGITEEFEIGDTSEGVASAQEGDRNFARLFCGRAFVAEVTRTESGGYINNNIQRLVNRAQWTEKELASVNAWEAAQLAKPRAPEDAADDSHVASSTDDQFDDELDPADDVVAEDW